MLKEQDLTGGTAAAQQQAIAAYEEMQKKIEQLPGDNTAGTLFAAGAYLFPKYQWAFCILTVESGSRGCWMATAKFIAGTSTFFQKIFMGQTNSPRKQDLLTELQKLKPAIASVTEAKLILVGPNLVGLQRWRSFVGRFRNSVSEG